jgi:TonB family protein
MNYTLARRICLSIALLTPVGSFYAAGEPPVLTLREAARFLVVAPQPWYPVEARRSHLSGSGLFQLVVSKTGEVTEVRVLESTGHRILDLRASQTLRLWRFKPGAVTYANIPITFKRW